MLLQKFEPPIIQFVILSLYRPRHSGTLILIIIIMTIFKVKFYIHIINANKCIFFLFAVALRPTAGHGLLILEVSRSHTTTHTTSSGRVISSSQRPLPDNTQHSQQTNIQAHGGIRTHDLCRRAAADHALDRAATATGANEYTGCPRRSVPDFGRVFLMLKYTDITQNTYVQS